MGWAFYIAALVTLGGAFGAMLMRNLVHAALFLAISFAGVAILFLKLDVPFAAFAQLLVYVGAVAILILFAILLTRSGGPAVEDKSGILGGLAVTVLAGGALVACISGSQLLNGRALNPTTASTRVLGEQLISRQVVSLEAVAVLLTVALLGAVILALPEKPQAEGME